MFNIPPPASMKLLYICLLQCLYVKSIYSMYAYLHSLYLQSIFINNIDVLQSGRMTNKDRSSAKNECG